MRCASCSEKACYDDDEAKDYDIRIGSGMAGITHGLRIAPEAGRGKTP